MDYLSAWKLVCEFVDDPSLRRHMVAVAAAMRLYAAKLGQDVERWGIVGLIHDFDWQIHPTLPEHPLKGAQILRQRGVDDQIIRTILSHYTSGTGVERCEPIDFSLLACDEITGLVIASALVRPAKDIRVMAVKSIKKKWKDKSFAAGVNRKQVEQATTDFSNTCFDGQLDLWQHTANVLEAMQGAAEALELDGRLAKPGNPSSSV